MRRERLARMATVASVCMLAAGCGEERPGSRPVTRHVVAPACASMEFSYVPDFASEDVTLYEPTCFPPYFYRYEGYFLAATGQPVPRLEKACGAFRILVVFFDTEAHREALRQNPSLSEEARAQVRTDVRAALTTVFAGYGPEQVFSHQPVRPPITFTYDVRLSSRENANAPGDDEPIDSSRYDAAVFLEDLPGPASGFGIGRWPVNHPIFRTDEPAVLRIDPLHLSPGLFWNELFRRNVPVLLSEYVRGPETYEEVNGITYDRTQTFNPRTGLVMDEADIALLSRVLNGWHDVDEDGILDCEDTEIEAAPGNVDADLLPDRLDPNLDKDNGPYFWTRG